MTISSSPRYDRIFSLVLVVLLGLAVIFLIDINPNILRARLFGDLPTITVSWLLIASLVAVTSTGADVLARAHPQMQHRNLPTINLGLLQIEVAPGFWVLPSFSIVSSFAFFRLFSGSLQGAAFVLALLAAGSLLVAVLVCQHYALDRDPVVSQRARLALQMIALLLAFACFSAIYYARLRTLYAATLIGSAGALLAFGLLHWLRHRQGGLLALLVGLLLAEVTWAINYWPTSFLLGGTTLLVVFYVVVSLVQHQLAGSLQRRLLIEYGALGGVLLVTVVFVMLRGA